MNAIGTYLSILARLAAAEGALPRGAASAAALRPVWASLAAEIEAELQARLLAAAAAGIADAAGVPRDGGAALDAVGFGPDARALDLLRRRVPVGSTLSAADWALMPRQLRNTAQFSARVASARAMAAVQQRLEGEAAWDFKAPTGREAFIRDMRQVMQAEGVGWESAGEGSLRNPQANSRLGMVYDIQTRQAREAARYVEGLGSAALYASPAREFLRIAARGTERPWAAKWRRLGGQTYGGKMIALKTDPIWFNLGPFGNPYPPFDYNSGMGVRDLTRHEAEQLGVVDPAWEPDIPSEHEADLNMRASVDGVPPPMREWIKESFGGQVEFDADTARWTGARPLSRTEADSWGARASAGLPADARGREALRAYQERETYGEINRSLWAGVETDTSRALDRAMADARTREPAVTWRMLDGRDLPEAKARNLVGTAWTQRGYASTTFSRDVAETDYAAGKDALTLLEIYVPKGAQGVYLNAATGGRSAQGGEQELLLARGTRLYVRGLARGATRDGRAQLIVKAEVVYGRRDI